MLRLHVAPTKALSQNVLDHRGRRRDANGNLTNPGDGTTYSYDSGDRTTSITPGGKDLAFYVVMTPVGGGIIYAKVFTKYYGGDLVKLALKPLFYLAATATVVRIGQDFLC